MYSTKSRKREAARSRAAHRRPARGRRPLDFEPLEDRTLLSLTVSDFDVAAFKGDTGESASDRSIGVLANPAAVNEAAVDNFLAIGTLVPGNPAPVVTVVDPPVVTVVEAPDVGEPEIGDTEYNITVTYADDSAIDVSTIGTSDVTISGPGVMTVISATPDSLIDATPVTVTYTFIPPGGSWDAADDGTYTIAMNGDEVGDDDDPQEFVAANPALGTFDVNATNPPPTVCGSLAEDVIHPDLGMTIYPFTIDYCDGGGIDPFSINAADVTVVGPLGPLPVVFGIELSGTEGSPKTGNYLLQPPGGSWDLGDEGTYTIGVRGDEVCDINGACVAANASVTTFEVVLTRLYDESLETDGLGSRYITSTAFKCGSPATSYWDRTDGSDIDTLATYTGLHGKYFWGRENVDECSGNLEPVQWFESAPIIISSHTGLQFEGLFASTGNSLGAPGPFDTGDFIKVRYSVDGGPFADGLCFGPDADSLMALDTTCGGTGDGAPLTSAFSTFSFAIPDGNTLVLRIEVKADGDGEEVAFDSLRVTGSLAPPTVEAVLVRGSSWTPAYLDYLAAAGMGDGGYSIPTGSAAQLAPLPWVNLDRIIVRFSEDVLVQLGDLAIGGVNTAVIATSAFSYNPSTFEATWVFSSFLTTDKLLLALDGTTVGAVVDVDSGLALDGEFANGVDDLSSSGDGTAGGDLGFRFNVLPGDVNQSTAVNLGDVLPVFFAVPSVIGDAAYSVLFDVNGSGTLNLGDVLPIFFAVPDSLPEGEPVAAPTAAAFETLGAFFGPLGATSGLVGDRLGQGEQPHHMPRGAARSREPATPHLPYMGPPPASFSARGLQLPRAGDHATFEPPSDAAAVTGQVGRRAAVDLAFADFGADPLEHDLQTDVARDRVG